MKLGLENMRGLLDELAAPQHHYRVLQIAGTNGKGSTSAYLAAGLQAAGMRVGLFTSPHLVDFRERVRVDGEPIGEGEVVRAWRKIRSEVERRQMTFFEANTAVALLHFAARACDVAVLETGMGGRLDATTAAEASLCVLTRIAFDHREYLGTTLRAIAEEKAAILRPGTRGFSAPQSPEAERAIRRSAERAGADLTFVARPRGVRVDAEGTTFRWRGEPVRLRMVGRHQAENALVALEVLSEALPGAPSHSLVDAVERVEVPGRFQRMERPSGTLLLDVAHNPDALGCFVRALDDAFPDRAKRVYVAMLREKDLGGSLEALHRCAALELPLLVGSAESAPEPRRLRHEDWLSLAKPRREGSVWVGSVPAGLARLEAWQAQTPEGVAAVVGSFTSVGEAMHLLGVDTLGT